MQTFLPYSEFSKTADSLDYRRLGKQRVEAFQIINVLTNVQKTAGWRNHPAVKMWENNIDALKLYHNEIIKGWLRRGYRNNMNLYEVVENPEMPWWMGNEDMHRSHRARLIVKLPDYYEKQWPADKGFNEGRYWWPVNNTKSFKTI